MRQLIYLKDVVTLQLDRERCVGCGMCQVVCPHAVLHMNDGCVSIEDRDACMECGACQRNCPTEALTVQTGVGCANAVINAAFGREASSCRCVVDTEEKGGDTPESFEGTSCSGCC